MNIWMIERRRNNSCPCGLITWEAFQFTFSPSEAEKYCNRFNRFAVWWEYRHREYRRVEEPDGA